MSIDLRRLRSMSPVAGGATIGLVLALTAMLTASASTSDAASSFRAMQPCRVLDTRPAPDNVGPRSTPLRSDETLVVQLVRAGPCPLPAGTSAVVMNVAIVNPTADSFLTVFPFSGTRPLAANLNWRRNDPPQSNSVTAALSTDGALGFYNLAGTVDIVADIVGYYTDSAAPAAVALSLRGIGFTNNASGGFVPVSSRLRVTAFCPLGQVVTGGGWRTVGEVPGKPSRDDVPLTVFSSRPIVKAPGGVLQWGWEVYAVPADPPADITGWILVSETMCAPSTGGNQPSP